MPQGSLIPQSNGTQLCIQIFDINNKLMNTQVKARDILIESDDIIARLIQGGTPPEEARRLATASLKDKYGTREGFAS